MSALPFELIPLCEGMHNFPANLRSDQLCVLVMMTTWCDTCKSRQNIRHDGRVVKAMNCLSIVLYTRGLESHPRHMGSILLILSLIGYQNWPCCSNQLTTGVFLTPTLPFLHSSWQNLTHLVCHKTLPSFD